MSLVVVVVVQATAAAMVQRIASEQRTGLLQVVSYNLVIMTTAHNCASLVQIQCYQWEARRLVARGVGAVVGGWTRWCPQWVACGVVLVVGALVGAGCCRRRVALHSGHTHSRRSPWVVLVALLVVAMLQATATAVSLA